MTSYQKLKENNEIISKLGIASSSLEWDRDAGFMPEGGAEERGAVLGALAGVIHEKSSDPRIGEWIKEAEQEQMDDPWDQRNFTLIKESYLLSKALPIELVKEIKETGNECAMAYATAKDKSDWKAVEGPVTVLPANSGSVQPSFSQLSIHFTHSKYQVQTPDTHAQALTQSPPGQSLRSWQPDWRQRQGSKLFGSKNPTFFPCQPPNQGSAANVRTRAIMALFTWVPG